MKQCTICQKWDDCKYLDLYTIGSEGTQVCHSCELALVEFAQTLIRIATKSRKIGYQNAKDVRKALEDK